MKFVLFYHSLVSDWNHGNAHFLRGIVRELIALGHRVDVYEPSHGWSLENLLAAKGPDAVRQFHQAYPGLTSHFYSTNDVPRALDDADVVIVHEWNTPALIAEIGRLAYTRGIRAYFHDTHHRCVTDPAAMALLDLSGYEGVLAFGNTLAECYRRHRWADQVWVWHEAADTRLFVPTSHPDAVEGRDPLVWIGNWGDDERTAELHEFLIDPIADLRLRARIHGVRYPRQALRALKQAGIEYGGWLPNHKVPGIFARHQCTVHVPRRAYREALRGIPTIRMFEALACALPLISAPWDDDEQLFRPGTDYLVARDGRQMREHLRAVLNTPSMAAELARNGLQTVRSRHTCAQRVRELLQIIGSQPISAAVGGLA